MDYKDWLASVRAGHMVGVTGGAVVKSVVAKKVLRVTATLIVVGHTEDRYSRKTGQRVPAAVFSGTLVPLEGRGEETETR